VPVRAERPLRRAFGPGEAYCRRAHIPASLIPLGAYVYRWSSRIKDLLGISAALAGHPECGKKFMVLPTVLPTIVLLHNCCHDRQHAAPGADLIELDPCQPGSSVLIGGVGVGSVELASVVRQLR
jgi:hypothetical protein